MTTETLPAVAPETVSPLKPSEALRLGRLTRPRRIENWYYAGDDGACALGAILEGAGNWAATGLDNPLLNTLCPVCGPYRGRVVTHLNDHHHWSDDQIVAWLESLGL